MKKLKTILKLIICIVIAGCIASNFLSIDVTAERAYFLMCGTILGVLMHEN
jgi:hypothetical protein